jgi:hypothetical protein
MSKKLNQALGDWHQSATNVKARIYAETIEGTKKKNKRPMYFKIGLTAAVLAVGVATTTWLTTDRTPSPTSLNETEQQEEQRESSYREISEMYIKIAQYENFYNSDNMKNGYYVIWETFAKAIEYYSLLDYITSTDIEFTEESRELARNSVKSAFEYDLKDPEFSAYFEKLKTELSITEEIYIDEFLLIEREYDLLRSKMSADGVSYAAHEAQENYRKKLGITIDYEEYLFSRAEERIDPLDPQPELLFNQKISEDDFFSLVALNSDGEYIFTDASFSWMDLPFHLHHYFYQFQQSNKLPDLTRITFPKYKEAIELSLTQQDELELRQLQEYFEIAERSIEWAFTPELYIYNDLPTFDLSKLRTHDEQSVQIIEHMLYYKDPILHSKATAYREAVNEITNMYGLFNYLAQEYKYGWNSSIRNEHAAQLKAAYEEELLQNPSEKQYFEQLTNDLHITIDDYVNHYLVIVEEYETVRAGMIAERIGLNSQGRYYSNLQQNKYQNSIQLQWSKVSERVEILFMDDHYYEELSPQPALPFEVNEYWPITVAENENGEYILSYANNTVAALTDAQKEVYLTIEQTYNLEPLARYNTNLYIEYVQTMNSTAASELYEILLLFDRTVNE